MRGGRLGRVKPTFTLVQDSGGCRRQDSELLAVRPREDGPWHLGGMTRSVEGETPGEGEAQESIGPGVILNQLPMGRCSAAGFQALKPGATGSTARRQWAPRGCPRLVAGSKALKGRTPRAQPAEIGPGGVWRRKALGG